MIGKIDIMAAFNYIWKSPLRNEILIKWGVIGIIYMVTTFVVQFGLNIIGVVAGEDSAAFGILAIVIVLAIYLFMFVISIFAYGAGVNNYIKIAKNFKEGKRDAVAQDSSLEFKKALINGFKMMGVVLYYSIPYLVISVIFIIGIVAAGRSMSFSEGGNNEQDALILILLGIFLVFAFLYAIFLNLGVYPATLKIAEEKGFRAALNVSELINVIKANFKNYLWLMLANFVVGIGAVLLWLGSALSIIICIGIVILPMAYGWLFMIQAYIGSHLAAQANIPLNSTN